ncbi:pyochelin biosynthetic protein PchC [Betaproteobacteria bacterium]|nr:pyochelin biosynthetic protein PchC [Betaproteobacteria bacterium]GHU27419.1 pyochelin biosynthetic protein PchC [Betaproteobacteria bacterium]
MSESPVKTQLFLLAHAGGNATQYAYLLAALRQSIVLVPLDLPGHGERAGEALLHTVPEMVNDVTRAMRARLTQCPDLPYAIFGHSLGSLLGYLSAVTLAGENRPPVHLFVSSGCVPGQHYVPGNFSQLSDEALWQASARYFGGISEEALACEELQHYFTPLLKADLMAVTCYKPATLHALEVPITAIYGETDVVAKEDMEKWRRLCVSLFQCHCIQGGHFYLFQQAEVLATRILAGLDQLDEVVLGSDRRRETPSLCLLSGKMLVKGAPRQ